MSGGVPGSDDGVVILDMWEATTEPSRFTVPVDQAARSHQVRAMEAWIRGWHHAREALVQVGEIELSRSAQDLQARLQVPGARGRVHQPALGVRLPREWDSAPAAVRRGGDTASSCRWCSDPATGQSGLPVHDRDLPAGDLGCRATPRPPRRCAPPRGRSPLSCQPPATGRRKGCG
jgi:hypothetical protein